MLTTAYEFDIDMPQQLALGYFQFFVNSGIDDLGFVK